MRFRLVPLFGVLVAAACYLAAIWLYPGGYDWNRQYISTLLRGSPSPGRIPAVAGVFIFCVSIAFVFDRLARAVGSSATSKAIRIGGIGSMVYSSLVVTPMHDLMVTISIPFFVVAILALLRVLYASREAGFLVTGTAVLALLVVSVIIYYTGQFTSVLPWTQRSLFALFAAWLLTLDIGAPNLRLAQIA